MHLLDDIPAALSARIEHNKSAPRAQRSLTTRLFVPILKGDMVFKVDMWEVGDANAAIILRREGVDLKFVGEARILNPATIPSIDEFLPWLTL